MGQRLCKQPGRRVACTRNGDFNSLIRIDGSIGKRLLGRFMAKVTLHAVLCHAKTESDADEIYCLVTTGTGSERREVMRFDVGNFEIGCEIRPARLVWNGTAWPDVTITVMENDANEPGRGADDFIGEVTVSADGNCQPGRATLDEGYDQTKRFRRFSMTGSGAHYLVQLEVQT